MIKYDKHSPGRYRDDCTGRYASKHAAAEQQLREMVNVIHQYGDANGVVPGSVLHRLRTRNKLHRIPTMLPAPAPTRAQTHVNRTVAAFNRPALEGIAS
jgi:hypothetical protein